MIKPPSLPPQDPDRGIETQIAIEAEFDALADAAKESGRTGEEVAVALLEVAIGRIETRFARLDTDEVIKAATERVEAVEDLGDEARIEE